MYFSDRYVIVGSHHSSLPGYSSEQWAHGTAVMTALIQALMRKVKKGWRPERTIIFCSWGGTMFGKIGSYEWAEVRMLTGFFLHTGGSRVANIKDKNYYLIYPLSYGSSWSPVAKFYSLSVFFSSFSETFSKHSDE